MATRVVCPANLYRRRWKIERLFASLQNFRRLIVRYERYAENFLGMLPPRLLFDLGEAFMRRVVVNFNFKQTTACFTNRALEFTFYGAHPMGKALQ